MVVWYSVGYADLILLFITFSWVFRVCLFDLCVVCCLVVLRGVVLGGAVLFSLPLRVVC